MILRRFMQHVKEQNWFAVGLDVIVVIVGIFLGLQVTEWYEEQGERVQEKVYLNRLHEEVTQALDFTGENYDVLLILEDFLDVKTRLREVLDVLGNIDSETSLNDRHCFAVFASHIYNDQQTYLPTLTELTSSGQLQLFQNEEVKISLSKYSLSFDQMKALVNNLTFPALILSRKYPNLITLDHHMEGLTSEDNFKHVCDFDKMKDNKSFNNDLIDNNARHAAFIDVLTTQHQMLINLHGELDKELGINHEGENS